MGNATKGLAQMALKPQGKSTYLLSNSSQRAIQEVLRAKMDLRGSLDAGAWTKMSVIGWEGAVTEGHDAGMLASFCTEKGFEGHLDSDKKSLYLVGHPDRSTLQKPKACLTFTCILRKHLMYWFYTNNHSSTVEITSLVSSGYVSKLAKVNVMWLWLILFLKGLFSLRIFVCLMSS